jgi:hypothetical protein
MVNINQSEFGRAVRGIPPGGSLDIEYFLLGMRSSAGAAIRRVHDESPDRARAGLAAKMSDFLLQGGAVAAFAQSLQGCLEQYIAWDGGIAAAYVAAPTKGTPITFDPGNIVRARPDVVLDDGSGAYEARVLLWDDLTLDRKAAEMIALPVVEYVEGKFGPGSTSSVSVWQLVTGEQESVAPPDAEARRADVEALLASF